MRKHLQLRLCPRKGIELVIIPMIGPVYLLDHPQRTPAEVVILPRASCHL